MCVHQQERAGMCVHGWCRPELHTCEHARSLCAVLGGRLRHPPGRPGPATLPWASGRWQRSLDSGEGRKPRGGLLGTPHLEYARRPLKGSGLLQYIGGRAWASPWRTRGHTRVQTRPQMSQHGTQPHPSDGGLRHREQAASSWGRRAPSSGGAASPARPRPLRPLPQKGGGCQDTEATSRLGDCGWCHKLLFLSGLTWDSEETGPTCQELGRVGPEFTAAAGVHLDGMSHPCVPIPG